MEYNHALSPEVFLINKASWRRESQDLLGNFLIRKCSSLGIRIPERPTIKIEATDRQYLATLGIHGLWTSLLVIYHLFSNKLDSYDLR